ncbi:hypothetical protein V6N13_083288 [Hibiscus sabdariffa]|uniref:Uncharacterized protein n=1 Tax=Hibiscus sabdariffa TaxID=183260 RepID=A0ABR2SY51_9ROSI
MHLPCGKVFCNEHLWEKASKALLDLLQTFRGISQLVVVECPRHDLLSCLNFIDIYLCMYKNSKHTSGCVVYTDEKVK